MGKKQQNAARNKTNNSEPSGFRPGDLVIGYFRDSGGSDQDRSVDEQRAEWLVWCNQRQLIPFREFADRIKTGTTTKGRRQFLAMVDYFQSGQARADGVRGLLIWKFSRFAREEVSAQYYVNMLRYNGYVVQSLTDNIPEGDFSNFFEALTFWKDAQYSRDLAEHVKRGQRYLLNNYRDDGGLYVLPSGEKAQLTAGGPSALGYERIPVQTGVNREGKPRFNTYWKKTEDKDLARRVRLAWDMMLVGHSYGEIEQACHFNRSLTSYNDFFSNYCYTGVYIYGDFIREGAFEPYITKEEYELVQKRIEGRAAGYIKRRPGARRYMLSGMVYCGLCGSPAHGLKTSKQGYDYSWYYYECSGRKTLKNLHNIPPPKVRMREAEQSVLQTVVDEILNEDKLHQLAIGLCNLITQAQAENGIPERLTALEKVVQEESDKIRKLALQLATTAPELDIVKDVQVLITEAQNKRQLAEKELERLRHQDAASRINQLKINTRLVQQMRKALQTIAELGVSSGEKPVDHEGFKAARELLGMLGLTVHLYPAGFGGGSDNEGDNGDDPSSGGDNGSRGMMLIKVSPEAVFTKIISGSGEEPLFAEANGGGPLTKNSTDSQVEFKVAEAKEGSPGGLPRFTAIFGRLEFVKPLPKPIQNKFKTKS